MRFKWWYGALIFALFLAAVSPLASSSPDGLERIAEDNGFMEIAREASFEAIPGYMVPGIKSEAVATILAGLIGTLLVFAIGYSLARLLKAKGDV